MQETKVRATKQPIIAGENENNTSIIQPDSGSNDDGNQQSSVQNKTPSVLDWCWGAEWCSTLTWWQQRQASIQRGAVGNMANAAEAEPPAKCSTLTWCQQHQASIQRGAFGSMTAAEPLAQRNTLTWWQQRWAWIQRGTVGSMAANAAAAGPPLIYNGAGNLNDDLSIVDSKRSLERTVEIVNAIVVLW